MNTEVIVTGEETSIEEAAVSVEAAAATALAEVAVAAIEESAERVDELARTRAQLDAALLAQITLTETFNARFAELEARIADAQFTASAAAEIAAVVADDIDEELEDVEDEVEEEFEDAEIPVVIAGEEVVAVAPLIDAENPPVLHEEALTTAAKKKRGFIRI